MAHIMFFDPAISGHHPEYIRHIIKYILRQDRKDNYYFVVNPDFVKNFNDINNLAENKPTIKIVEIDMAEYGRIYSGKSLIKRSINEFKVMKSYALKLKIDHCVLLHLNSFQFALGIYKTSYAIHGILFAQYTWQVFSDNFKGWLYKKRKIVQTEWMQRNKKIKNIFLLNDTESCGELNRLHKTGVFKYLPDPVVDSQPEIGFNLRAIYDIQQNRKIYLHAGSIEARKGTLDIIDSIKYLDDAVRSNICIIIMGKATVSFDELISQKIKEVYSLHDVKIIYENGYIPDSRFKSMFEQSDFILMPYKNTEASSGILGHAIINEKLIIGPKQGLLGHLIARNKLGYSLDHIDSTSIAVAITEYFYKQPTWYDETMRVEYIQTHTGDAFAKVIFDYL